MIQIKQETNQPLSDEKQEKELIDIVKNLIFQISNLEHWNDLFIHNTTEFLYPFFQRKLEILKANYDKLNLGNTIKVFESFRSNARQHYVYHTGASNIQYLGMHYFFVAVDIIFFKDNKISWTGDWAKLWEIGKKLLFNPVSSSDLCHFQYIRFDEQNTIRKIYKRVICVFQQLTEIKVDSYLGPITHTKLIQNLPYFEDNWKKILNLL
jgi:hypothetical protein